MEKSAKIIIVILVLIVLAGAAIFYFSDSFLTGQAIGEINISTYTKALCNETWKGDIYCEDYEIACEGREISGLTPTGNFVYHEPDWEDPRGENGSEIVCE